MIPGRLVEHWGSVQDQALWKERTRKKGQGKGERKGERKRKEGKGERCCILYAAVQVSCLRAEQACSSSGAAPQMHLCILFQASWENRLYITAVYPTGWRTVTRKKCKSGKRKCRCWESFFRHPKGLLANSFVFLPKTRQQWDWIQEKAQYLHQKPHTLPERKASSNSNTPITKCPLDCGYEGLSAYHWRMLEKSLRFSLSLSHCHHLTERKPS